jgi:hypothetical protein
VWDENTRDRGGYVMSRSLSSDKPKLKIEEIAKREKIEDSNGPKKDRKIDVKLLST